LFAVALIELATSAEEEASVLARELGVNAYDLRLHLSGMLPAVIMTTPDADAADVVLRAVRQRGHGAVACDLRRLVPSTSMVSVRHFALDDAGMRADVGPGEVLPYGVIQAFVHAAHPELHRMLGYEHVYVSPRQGVVRRETMTSEHDASQSLYIFRADSETPWIMREREAHYAALGPGCGPVQHQNFLAAIRILRARAPNAYFDDRLAVHPRSPEHFTLSLGRPDGGALPWADHGADLAAYLLALWAASKAAGDPYRS
jgi:hypothetical protein